MSFGNNVGRFNYKLLYYIIFTLINFSSCVPSKISSIAGSLVAKTSSDTHSSIVVTEQKNNILKHCCVLQDKNVNDKRNKSGIYHSYLDIILREEK